MLATSTTCKVEVKETPSSGAKTSLLANSAWNYAGTAVNIVSTLIMTPVYVRAMGLEQYGILAVLSAILAPIGVLNVGVTQASVKFVAFHSAKNEFDEARDAVAASLTINLAIGIAGALLCFLGAAYFPLLGFKISPELQGDAITGLRLIGGVWLVTQVAGNFRGVLEGLRQQRRVMYGDTLTVLANVVCCLPLVLITHRLSWFITGQLIATAAVAIYWWHQARRELHGLRLAWKSVRNAVPHVYSYSFWQTVNAATAIAANVGDRYFIGIWLSAATLGSYNVALRVQSVGRTLFYAANQALFPAASAASAEPGVSERLVVTASWYIALFAGLGLGIMTICGPGFLELWIGAEVRIEAGFVLRVFLITLLFEIPSAIGSSYLNAHALTKLTAANNVATTIVTLGLMFPLGISYGINGVAVAALVGLAFTRAPFQVWMHARYFARYVSRGEFLKSFYGVGACNLAGILAVSPLFDLLYKRTGGGVVAFVVAFVPATVLYIGLVCVMVRLVLNQGGRLGELWQLVVARGRQFALAWPQRRESILK